MVTSHEDGKETKSVSDGQRKFEQTRSQHCLKLPSYKICVLPEIETWRTLKAATTMFRGRKGHGTGQQDQPTERSGGHG